MPAFDQRVVRLAARTYDRLTAVRGEIAADKQRMVTYDEAVEYLLDLREAKAMIGGRASGVTANGRPAGEAVD